MSGLLLSLALKFWPVLVGLGGAVVMFLAGRKSGTAARDKRDATAFQKTTERISDADVVGNDPDAARRWLAERGKRLHPGAGKR